MAGLGSLAHGGWLPGGHSVVMLGRQSFLGASPASPLMRVRRSGSYSQWQRRSTAIASVMGVTARLRIALPAPWHAAQSCRQPCLHKGASRQWQGNRHHCLSVCDGLGGQSVGKAGYRHAKAIGNGSLSHRAGSPNPTPVHHLQRRQNYITPYCPQCPPVSR